MFETCIYISLYNHCILCKRRKTFERIDRTGERNKTDIGATNCNPFERNFNNPFEREYKTTRQIITEPSDYFGLLPLCPSGLMITISQLKQTHVILYR